MQAPTDRGPEGSGLSRLSVLLPCRDAAQHLPTALASIEAQSYRDFEVIAVDDGSMDGTGELLDALASRDRRVRIIHQPALGLVPALRTALAAASGEIIARMDADDVAHPDRFGRQLELLDSDRTIDVCGTLVRYMPRSRVRDGALRYERWINSLTDHAQIERDMFVECPIPHPTLMLRRSALDDVGGYTDPGWPEDYDLMLRLWAAGHRFAKVEDVLLDWTESATRLSRTDPRYGEAAFRRCKVEWLRRTLLSGREGIVIWGAGPVGKAMSRTLADAGVTVRAFVELDPRKIGQTIHGAPVVPPPHINSYRGALALAAVASATARAEIRAALDAAGWTEMRDYCAVA